MQRGFAEQGDRAGIEFSLQCSEPIQTGPGLRHKQIHRRRSRFPTLMGKRTWRQQPLKLQGATGSTVAPTAIR
jgi:uncharacterized protein with beta-barrel porin domain